MTKESDKEHEDDDGERRGGEKIKGMMMIKIK